jgi:RimJ/RimL family protein N-acetyltransferase
VKLINIYGKYVTLRAIEPEDLPWLQQWSNDPEIQYMLGGWHFPSSSLVMEKWLNNLQSDHLNQRFAIVSKQGELIGTTNLVNINWKDRNAFTGIVLSPEARGKGYGTDTVLAIMRYAFEELAFERLDTTIIEYNEPSYRMYTKSCSWKEEGRKKNYYWRKNRFWDQIIVGINRDDYFAFMEK